MLKYEKEKTHRPSAFKKNSEFSTNTFCMKTSTTFPSLETSTYILKYSQELNVESINNRNCTFTCKIPSISPPPRSKKNRSSKNLCERFSPNFF